MAEVASAYVSLLPSFRGGAGAISKELGGPLDDAGRDGGKRFGGGMQAGIAGIAARVFAPLAAAAASVSLGAFLKGAIDQASDLSEAGTALNQVFGTATSQVTDFAARGAAALGQNTLEVQRAAQTFGVYGNAAGLAADANATFSTDLVQLSTDLASFYNVEPGQAVEALAAGLRGESEPLRQFGILLDDATLKARAMELGIYDGTGSLTQQQKILASQAEIMEQASVASGDFARTSEGLANQQRILSAQFADFRGTVGTIFLPAITAVVTSINTDFMPGLLNGATAVAAFAEGIRSAGIDTALQSVRDIIVNGDFTGAFAQAFGVEEDSRIVSAILGIRSLIVDADFTGALNHAFGLEEDSPVVGFLLSMREAIVPVLQTIGDSASAYVAPLGDAFGALIGALGPLLPQLLAAASAFNPLSLVFNALLPVLPRIAGLIGTLAATLITALGPILSALVPVLATVAQTLIGALGQAFVALLPIITGLLPVISSLVGIVGGVLLTVIQALAPVLSAVADAFATILPVVATLLTPLLGIVEALLPLVGVIGELIGALLPPLVDLFMALLRPILDLIAPLVGALTPVLQLVADLIGSLLVPVITFLAGLLGTLVQAITPVIAAIAGGLVTAISTLVRWVGNVVSAIASFVSDSIGRVKEFAENVGRNIGLVLGIFREMPGGILGALGAIGRLLFSVGQDLLQGLINGIKDKVSGAVSAVKDAVSSVIDGAKSLLGINSPSRVFMEIGAFTGEGLALGLAGEQQRVREAMRDLVQVPDATAARYAGAFNVGGRADRPPTTINNYGAALTANEWLRLERAVEAVAP